MRFLISIFYGTILVLVYLFLACILLVDIFLIMNMIGQMLNQVFHPNSFGECLGGIFLVIPLLCYAILGITTVFVIRRVRIGMKSENGKGKNIVKPLLVLLFLVLFAALSVIPWVFIDRLTSLAAWSLLGLDVCYVGSQLKK